MTSKQIIVTILVIIVLASAAYFIWSGEDNKIDTQVTPTVGAPVTYTCADDSAFTVAYGTGASTGIAMVTVEGDMVYTLEGGETATGVRYANDNDDFVFEVVNGTAAVTQMGEPTYQGCGEGSQMVQ